MSRPPHARARILQAASEIARSEGARGLTLEGLSRRSGTSRSGVLYHWPTRAGLLDALVEHDLHAWGRQCRESAPESAPRGLGHVRSSLDHGHAAGEILAVLLPELRQSPGAWSRLRQRVDDGFRWEWTDDDVARYVLMLAAEGHFWRRVHGLEPTTDQLASRVGARIEAWLAELG